jgi:flagellin-specific chaperone FliS
MRYPYRVNKKLPELFKDTKDILRHAADIIDELEKIGDEESDEFQHKVYHLFDLIDYTIRETDRMRPLVF